MYHDDIFIEHLSIILLRFTNAKPWHHLVSPRDIGPPKNKNKRSVLVTETTMQAPRDRCLSLFYRTGAFVEYIYIYIYMHRHHSPHSFSASLTRGTVRVVMNSAI